METRVVRLLIVSVCLVAGLVSSAAAAPGDVDRTFGQEGIARVQTDQGVYGYPEDMAIAPGGEIYVLRGLLHCSASPCAYEQQVSRFTPGGLLDSSFGVAGTRTLMRETDAFPPGGFASTHNGSIALAPGGGVIVGSTVNGALLLGKLNPDGSPDAGFGNGGEARAALSAPIDRVRLAVQADGRIVAGAEPLYGYGGEAVLVTRYTAQGLPDPSFRGGNALITSLGSGFGGIALSGSKTVIAGPRCCGADGQQAVHLARIDQSGAFDRGFGREGERFVDDVTEGAGVAALIALPKGRILVVGSGSTGKGDSYALKLKPSGALDRTFGRRGIAYLRHKSLIVNDATVDRTGRLLIAGSDPKPSPRSQGGPRVLSVLRRLPDGHPDPTFAGGTLLHFPSALAGHADAVGLQQGRRLVVLASRSECFRSCDPPRTILTRFLGGTSGSRCLGRKATIVGTREGETLVGTPHRDVIATLAGSDRVFGRGGGDLICGGLGNDQLVGGKGRDRLSGGAGRNKVHQ